MRTIRTGAVAAAVLLALTTGCDTPKHPATPHRPAQTARVPAPADTAPDVRNVRGLCDFFAYRSLETLGKSEAQGNVTLYASRPGIPAPLVSAARNYYADGLYQDVAKNRAELDKRYANVIEQCRAAGTGWERP